MLLGYSEFWENPSALKILKTLTGTSTEAAVEKPLKTNLRFRNV
jgi:hypothetical protein